MDLLEKPTPAASRFRIDARQISLCYPARQGAASVALNNIDFSIAAGEMTGILGPSGSGKSSLLYVLSGLLRPTAGKVFYQDQDIAGWSPEAREVYRREHVGFIFQRHYLIGHLTLLENILLPVPLIGQADRERAAALLERLCPGLPGGLLPGVLSVGQRQLVAIARALINQPSIIFADEPTAALDSNTAFVVMDLMAERAAQTAFIVVTHDLKILRDAGRIIKLRDGCIVP